MNFFVFQLLVSTAFFVSSLSASIYVIDYSCPGLTGNAREDFDGLMDVLKLQENSLMNCMKVYSNSKSFEHYKNCITEIGLPVQLESRFMKSILPVSSMKLKIESVARSICIDFTKRLNSGTTSRSLGYLFVSIVPVLGLIVLIIVVAFLIHYIMTRRQEKSDIVDNIEGFDINADTSNP